MPRASLTRRRALELGAAAAATTALRPSVALARPAPTTFTLDVSDELPRATATATGRRHTLPPRRAPHRFDLLGVEWGRGAHVHVEVRARRRAGAWTPWTPLHGGGDHGPDTARAHATSEPVWTDTADDFQLRYTGAPRRLRVRFVRAKPAATAARRLHARATAAGAHAARSRKRHVKTSGLPPAIISRAAWGGDRYPPKETPLIGDVQVGFVHHTVTANDYGPEDSAAIVLGICRYHRDHNGWNDIGYNFLADKYGQIFEGRAGGIEQAIVGAQAQGYNSHSTSISCLGDYTSGPLSAQGTEAVARLLAWKLPLHLCPVEGEIVLSSAGGASNRYRLGTPVRFQRISGHRDGDATSCPGNALYAQLPALRKRIAQLAVPVSALTISAEETTLQAPATVALSGALRFSDGVSADGRELQIQYQTTAGAAWELADTVRTAPDGSYAIDVDAPTSGRVRSVLPDDGVHGNLSAAPVRIKVVPKLGLKINPRATRPGRSAKVSGTVKPFAPTRARLIFQRKIRGMHYRTLRRRSVRLRRGGRLLAHVRPPSRGTYRVTVRAAGSTIKRLLRVP